MAGLSVTHDVDAIPKVCHHDGDRLTDLSPSSNDDTAPFVVDTRAVDDLEDGDAIVVAIPQEISSGPAFEANVRTLLEDYRSKFIKANPKSEAAYQEASAVLAGGNTRSVLYYKPFPMVLVSGQGCHVTSEDGREYLDLVSEYSACMLGHSHPEIAMAVQATMARGINLGGASKEEQNLASLLRKRIPSMERLRFCNSGTEANTMALTAALHYTDRKKILAFENGYHGGFIGFAKGALPTTLPFNFVLARYDDPAHVRELVDSSFAAIIVEPMQSVGGMIPSSTQFLQTLRDVADQTGAVLIFDEVVTSRLHYNAMQAHHNVRPDMTTVGKFWGGGFSFGAFGGRAEIMRVLEPGRLSHSGTFNNNAFTMTAGAVACGLITEEKIAKANALGDRLREGLNAAGRHTAPTPWLWATGYGSMLNIHFGGTVAAELRDAFFLFMLNRGIYISQRGLMAINLVHTEGHVTQVLDARESATLDTWDNGKPYQVSLTENIKKILSVLGYYAGWTDKVYGQSMNNAGGYKLGYTRRDPIGVSGKIIPWSYPMGIASWKLGPGLACGNAVILKAAEQTRLTILYLANLLRKASFPPNIINLVNRLGPVTVAALCSHPVVDKVASSESTATGKAVMHLASETIKNMSLETGRKTPFLVFAGPQMSKAQYQRVLGLMETAKAQGAVLSGKALEDRPNSKALFVEPTIFTNVTREIELFQEDALRPVAPVTVFDTDEEALELAKDSIYGLGAAIFTQDI